MAKTTTTNKVQGKQETVTEAVKLPCLTKLEAMDRETLETLARIGASGNAKLAFQLIGLLDTLSSAIQSEEHLKLLNDSVSKVSGNGFSQSFRFSKDGEVKASKADRLTQAAYAGMTKLAEFGSNAPLLRERLGKISGNVSRKLSALHLNNED